MSIETKFKTGDLLEVTRKDNSKFKCVVIENYEGGFVSKVLEKDEKVGTATWDRYGLKEDGRFQIVEDCADIRVLAESKKSSAEGTLTLSESVSHSQMTYYTTPLSESKSITLCLCENYGGWSIHESRDSQDALKESFFNSQVSRLSSSVVEAQ